MELDFDYVRNVVCEIVELVEMNDKFEYMPINQNRLFSSLSKDDSKDVYHTLIMLHQKGYITTSPFGNKDEIEVLDLTVDGYEFYNLVKRSDIWENVKNHFAKIFDCLTFEIIIDYAKSIIKSIGDATSTV